MRRVARKIQEIMGLVTQVSNEIATGAREIKSFNNEDGEKDRFKRANDENLKQNLKMESTLNLSTPLIIRCFALSPKFKSLTISLG